MRALLNLRYTVPERQAAFRSGLRRLGYEVVQQGQADIAVSWNRIGHFHDTANEYERTGRPVIIVENSTWGNEFQGRRWYHLARSFHNTRGRFPVGDGERFDKLHAEPSPFRTHGETVVLMQRGIGPPQVAMPRTWTTPGRIRKHPGRGQAIPLEQDLARCGKVVTWGSGAAVKALMWGIPVESHMPNWIGEQDNTEEGRLRMLRELAWAQWTLEEIQSGEALECLLKQPA